MNKQTIYGILLLIAIGLVIWWMASRKKVKGGGVINYQFFRHQDSPGNDIEYRADLSGNIDGLKAACKQLPGCVAFNTSGYLKSAVDPTNFKEYSGFPDWAGLYVKRQAIR